VPGHRFTTLHRLDPEAAAKVIDHGDYFVRGWPSSAAKTPMRP
jgi:hypothetical protein